MTAIKPLISLAAKYTHFQPTLLLPLETEKVACNDTEISSPKLCYQSSTMLCNSTDNIIVTPVLGIYLHLWCLLYSHLARVSAWHKPCLHSVVKCQSYLLSHWVAMCLTYDSIIFFFFFIKAWAPNNIRIF